MKAVPFMVPSNMGQDHPRLVSPRSNSPWSRQLEKYLDPYSDLLFTVYQLRSELWDTPFLGRVEGMLYHVG